MKNAPAQKMYPSFHSKMTAVIYQSQIEERLDFLQPVTATEFSRALTQTATVRPCKIVWKILLAKLDEQYKYMDPTDSTRYKFRWDSLRQRAVTIRNRDFVAAIDRVVDAKSNLSAGSGVGVTLVEFRAALYDAICYRPSAFVWKILIQTLNAHYEFTDKASDKLVTFDWRRLLMLALSNGHYAMCSRIQLIVDILNTGKPVNLAEQSRAAQLRVKNIFQKAVSIGRKACSQSNLRYRIDVDKKTVSWHSELLPYVDCAETLFFDILPGACTGESAHAVINRIEQLLCPGMSMLTDLWLVDLARSAWQRLCDIAICLQPLHMPAYVLLFLSEQLELATIFTEKRRIDLFVNIANYFRQRCVTVCATKRKLCQ